MTVHRGKLLGFSGKSGSGKDTAADFLVRDFGYIKIAFADSLREAVWALNPIVDKTFYRKTIRYQDAIRNLGYEGAKKKHPEVRSVLQRAGTDMGRELFGDDFWIDCTMEKLIPDNNYVITDVRFPNEVKAIESIGGRVMRIERPGAGLEGKAGQHSSEIALDEYSFQFVIDNSGDLDNFLNRLVDAE